MEALATSLDVPADVGYTCETSQYFYLSTILTRWEVFEAKVAPLVAAGDTDAVADHFPFADFFADAPAPLFRRRDAAEDRAVAGGCFVHIKNIFKATLTLTLTLTLSLSLTGTLRWGMPFSVLLLSPIPAAP